MPVSDNLTYDSLTDAIAYERAQSLPDAADVQLYRRYALGRQIVADDALTEEQQEALTGLLSEDAENYVRFCDNLAHQVISIAADRIELERYDVAPVSANATADAEKAFLSELGIKCHMDSLQAEITYATLRDGNHAVGVSWDVASGRVVFHHEPWWDGESGMYVAYGENGLPAYAVKEWTTYEVPREYFGALGIVRRFVDGLLAAATGQADKAYTYRTVYQPDRILYFRKSTGGKWQAYNRQVEVEPGLIAEVSEVAWTKPDGRPLGIPVVHFANGSRANGLYGLSEIAGGFTGVQDQVNDIHLDLMALARYTAYQQTWIAGIPTVDANGEPLTPSIDSSPGATHIFGDPNAKMGVIPAGDSSNMLNVLKAKIQTGCRMTATPLHLITGGDQPSGEAIINLEAPLVNKTKKQVNKLKPAFVELVHRATEIANVRAGMGLNEDALITAEFANTERRNPLQLAEYVEKLSPFVSKDEVLRQFGFSPEKITQLNEEMEADDAAQQSLVDEAQKRIAAMSEGDAEAEDEFMSAAMANRARGGQ